MEGMKPVTPFLWDLPETVAGKLFLHLTLSDRKNLRLTCKRLYEFCNSDHFCKNEKIIWCQDLITYLNEQSDLFRIGRSYYNLEIEDKELEKASIEPFFEKLGSKIRSLVIRHCYGLPGSLDSIITLCENLCSLRLSIFPKNSTTLDFFTIEPFSITRPHVTYLKLTLPTNQPSDYFHRMFSIFPNVKELRIKLNRTTQSLLPPFYMGPDVAERIAEYSHIYEDIMKSGSNLECLDLQLPLSQSITKSNFFEALPNLKYLTVYFNRQPFSEIEQWLPRCSNLVSIELFGLLVFSPAAMIRLLTNTGLKSLIVGSDRLDIDQECFEKLVASQLNTLRLGRTPLISGPPLTILDSPLEVNKTVTDLFFNSVMSSTESTEMLYPKYFRGLVHLSISYATDSILQSIFENQEQLRSLQFDMCIGCSVKGFFGSKYSINNLQKLEHLSVGRIMLEVITAEEFKRPLSLPRLKYLRMDCMTTTRGEDRYDNERFAEISTVLYENLTELRALRLRDVAMPSRKTLSSLFSKLKHLDYLRYDMMHSYVEPSTDSVTFINTNCGYFLVAAEEYEHAYTLGHAFHDNELDRMVLLNGGLGRIFCSPIISTFKVDWIEA